MSLQQITRRRLWRRYWLRPLQHQDSCHWSLPKCQTNKESRDGGSVLYVRAFAACFIAACIALQEVLAGSQVEPAAAQQLLEGAGEAAAPAVEEPVQAIEAMPAVADEAAPMEEDAAEEDDDEDRFVI